MSATVYETFNELISVLNAELSEKVRFINIPPFRSVSPNSPDSIFRFVSHSFSNKENALRNSTAKQVNSVSVT